MSRKRLETEEDFLNSEPYKSIINILKIAPEVYPRFYGKGMKTMELMNLIIKGHTICKNRLDKQRMEILSEFREWILLYETKKIRLNQDIKPGIYKKKENKDKRGGFKGRSSTKYSKLFNNYLKRLEDFGWIKRKNGVNLFNNKYEFLLLRYRQKDIIKKTPMGCAIFHPSPGHSFTYYTPRIPVTYLKHAVNNLDSRVKKAELHFKEGQREWIGILSEARNKFVEDLWGKEFLQNEGIFVLAKLDFCLDIIFDERILWLMDVATPEKTTSEQWDFLMDIKKRVLEKYLQKKYPTLALLGIEKLHKKIQRERESKEKFFDGMYKKIKKYGTPSILEHIIVLDFLGTSRVKHDELVAKGAIPSTPLDRDKPVGEIYEALEKSSGKGYPFDTLENECPSKEYAVNERLYVEPPFFKDFFNGFEKDLEELGFKKDGDNGLEEFYKILDETAEILRIPALPDDLDMLLQK